MARSSAADAGGPVGAVVDIGVTTGLNPQTRIEVEDVETAIELMGQGLADTVVPKGAAEQLVPRLAPNARWQVLRPRQYDTFAIVHRVNATLSPAARRRATSRLAVTSSPVIFPVRRRSSAASKVGIRTSLSASQDRS